MLKTSAPHPLGSFGVRFLLVFTFGLQMRWRERGILIMRLKLGFQKAMRPRPAFTTRNFSAPQPRGRLGEFLLGLLIILPLLIFTKYLCVLLHKATVAPMRKDEMLRADAARHFLLDPLP